jgi:hypothetical protein
VILKKDKKGAIVYKKKDGAFVLDDDGQKVPEPAKVYSLMNMHLKDPTNNPVPPQLAEAIKNLRQAMKDAPPFTEPIKVERGVGFFDENTGKVKVNQTGAYIKPYEDCFKSYLYQLELQQKGQPAKMENVKMVQVTGFLSTGNVVPKGFSGNIQLEILAQKGLDVSPYTDSANERELLLDHETVLMVTNIIKKKVKNTNDKSQPQEFMFKYMIQVQQIVLTMAKEVEREELIPDEEELLKKQATKK